MKPLQVGRGAHKLRGINNNMTDKREKRRRAEIEKQIDENLRRVYEENATDEIPDRFVALLQQLREQEK